MFLAKINGNVVSTQKNESLKSHKLLLVRKIDLEGNFIGIKDEIALDLIDSGVGDTVLVVKEGAAVQQILGHSKAPVNTMIVAIVDGIDLEKIFPRFGLNENLETLTKLRLLLEVDGIGPGKLFNLLSKFNSLDNLINANYKSLTLTEGISQTLANKILKQIDDYSTFTKVIENELNLLEKNNAKWITFWSDNYPQNLKNIFAPPIILYYKGTLLKQDANSIAIVGTRMPTQYGKNIAQNFASDLAKKGIPVISGMARGIDSSAHWGSLKGSGRTIAIIGSGLDVIYPAENKKLFNQIIENGAVISEYKLGTKPDAQNFPKRNRIISGMSLGTLVVETKQSGGALQTAAYALEQNKEVFAIPGNLGALQSEGTNALIQKGEAKLVRNTDDILVELKLKIEPKIGKNIAKPTDDLNMFEQKVYEVLSDKPKHIDLIAKESKINSSECLVHLLSLEFRDYVQQLPGKVFVKS